MSKEIDTSSDLESIICLNQLFRPENVGAEPPKGMGYCHKCTKDIDNKNCTGYTPIYLGTYKVKYKSQTLNILYRH